MKTIVSFLILFIYIPFNTIGQDIQCSEQRYTDLVFTQASMSTVVYGENVNSLGITQDLSMDIYEPTGDTAPLRPLIILAHGGSFILGDKTQMADYCKLFASKGYVAATIQYRLWSLLQGFPDAEEATGASVDASQDFRAAIRYFYKQAQEGNDYKIDTTKIIIGGYSAGAITAIGTAYLDDNDDINALLADIIDEHGGIEGESGNQDYSTDALAVLNLSGAILDVNWINEGDLPIASFHGTADEVVPYDTGLANDLIEMQGSKSIDERMEVLGINHLLYTVEGGGHTNIYTDDIYLADREAFLTDGFAFVKEMICPLSKVDDIHIVKGWTSLSPNPTSDFINLNWKDQDNRSIKIYDIIGQRVLSQNTIGDQSHLNLSHLNKGVYIIQITHGNSPSYLESKKIIIE